MANDATVVIHGNLVRDPELKEVGASKAKVAAFTVAVSTAVKKADGTYETNFYDVSLWGPRGEAFAQHAEKGTAVQVVGDLSMVEYVSQKDNQKRVRLRVDAFKVKITAKAKGSEEAPRSPVSAPMPDDDPFGA